ncbi:hypothetical protein WDW89_13320 [Deltaproteobacteria bacterium TL4]
MINSYKSWWVCCLFTVMMTQMTLAATPTNYEYCSAYADAFFGNRNYRLSSTDSGSLTKKYDYKYFHLVLLENVEYAFLACGDESFEQLEMQIYDKDKTMLVEYGEPVNSPILSFKAKSTGIHTIVILAKQGTGNFVFLGMLKE